MKSMIEIVYKENKEQANGNEGYFHLPKNIRQVGDTNGRERIYLEDYVGTFLKKYFSAPEGRAAMLLFAGGNLLAQPHVNFLFRDTGRI